MNVYAGELCAVLLALEWVEEVDANKILICSVVSARSSIKSDQILFTNSRLARQEKDIAFMQRPAHS